MRPVPRYRLSGNTVYRTNGQQPVYVYHTATAQQSTATEELARQDLRLEAYLANMRRELAAAAATQPTTVEEDPLNPQRELRSNPFCRGQTPRTKD